MGGPRRLPAFVGGFRSGSTLLINLIGLHPEIAPWFETKAFCEPLRWLRELQRPEQAAFERHHSGAPSMCNGGPSFVASRMKADMEETNLRMEGRAPSGKAMHESYPLGCDCVYYALGEAETATNRWLAETTADQTASSIASATGRLITALGARHADIAGRPYWVNKTPEIPRFGRELEQALGPCHRILLVRDGRQVAASAHRLRWASIRELALWWKYLIELSREASESAPRRYLEVRYEDLVSSPAEILDRVFGFLQIDQRGESAVREYCRRMGRDAIYAVPRAAYSLAAEEQRAFDEVAGSLLRELGYVE